MNFISQTLAVTSMNLRNIPRRLGNSLVIVIGIAGAVAVFIPILAMSISFRATIEGDGSDTRAIVLTHRAIAESDSLLARDEVAATILEGFFPPVEASQMRNSIVKLIGAGAPLTSGASGAPLASRTTPW